MKILLLILAISIVSSKSKYEFEIVRTNNNQDVLWSIEFVEDENGKIIYQTDLSNQTLKPKQKIEVDQKGKYFFKFKSKFGDSIIKENSIKKRKQKIRFPKSYYQEIDFDKIKNQLIEEDQFQILHFNFGC